ncbi:MAG: hypothetical protein ACRD1L_08845 [Terriglobales bacterium]
MSSLAETPVPAAPAPAPADASDNHRLRSLWLRHAEVRKTFRHARRELLAIRSELGALLAAKQDALAHPGTHGELHAWLRANHIPRSTAYRLIHRHRVAVNSNPANGLNCPTETTPPELLAEVRGRTLLVRLSWQQAAVARRALTDARFDAKMAARIAQKLTDALTSLASIPARYDISNLWLQPPSLFLPRRFAPMPPTRLYRDPGPFSQFA